jgi:AraC-like DNA-binding protein
MRSGHVAVATTWAGDHNVIRSAKIDDPHLVQFSAARAGMPLISAIVSSGPLITITDGKKEEHLPGSLVLTWARRDLEERLVERSSVAAIRVERDYLHVGDRVIADALANAAGRSHWLTNLIRGVAQVATGVGVDPPAPPDPSGVDRYAAGILELVIRTVANVGLTAVPMSPLERRRHAEHYIERHLLESTLSARTVATHLGISVRQLARDLAGGPSATSMIQTARLRYADRLLRDPAHSGMTIARVAQLCQFSSQPLFSRLYKARFGITPRDARSAGAAAPAEADP